jgi:hypothetical protein
MSESPTPRETTDDKEHTMDTFGCVECGMALTRPEYHPYAFCVLKKAGLDPWETVRQINDDLGLVKELPDHPPLVRDMDFSRG